MISRILVLRICLVFLLTMDSTWDKDEAQTNSIGKVQQGWSLLLVELYEGGDVRAHHGCQP